MRANLEGSLKVYSSFRAELSVVPGPPARDGA